MTQPAMNEVQVIVFGQLRGYGESILVHLGDNSWMIVDSCINENDEPVAISYLKDIGVNISEAVKLVVATHWHDDHILGLSRTICKCSSAKFAMPSVFNQNEFLDFLSVYELASDELGAELRGSEITRCLEALDDTNNLMLRSENGILLRKGSDFFSHKKEVEVISLSPSDIHYNDFMAKIRAYSNVEGSEQILLKKQIDDCQNEFSMAILVKIGDISILLGSDVERGNAKYGWKRITSNCKDWNIKSRIYKVAHHGSKVKECGDVWSMLHRNTWSIVSPWTNGGKRLPESKDISFIRLKSYKALITSEPHVKVVSMVNGGDFVGEQDKIEDNRCGMVCLKFNTGFNRITGKTYDGACIL